MATVSPVLSGGTASWTTQSEAPVTPFAGITLADGNSGATDTLTITPSGAGGTLSDGTGFSGLIANANGTYTLTGTAAAITAELDALVFKPAAGTAGTSQTTTFALTDSSLTAGALTTLLNFNTTNGAHPFAGLSINAAGTLYGVTSNGASGGYGSVYDLFLSNGAYTGPVQIASFTNTNGSAAHGTLVQDAAGDLFGTTNAGGASGDGTVFEIQKGTLWSAPIVLATFNGTNGSNALDGVIIDAAGDLFGTTNNGGANGYGTVYEIPYTSSGYGALTTLASFSTATGLYPRGLVVDSAGNLFGETIQGGSATNSMGTVFEIAKTATGYAAPATLVSFTGPNGGNPTGGLVMDSAGDLFGETSSGGAASQGTVFEIVKGTGGYGQAITLASFDGVNQLTPKGPLLLDAKGDLFGTTYNGGAANDGSVFELVKTASGYGALITLATFNGTNGAYPSAGLVMDAAGNLYGTTYQGGTSNVGTVFEVSAAQIAQTAAATTISVTNTDPQVVKVAPTLANSATAPTYTVGGAAVAVASGLGITDPGTTNLASASVAITAGFQAGDTLSFTAQTGITASYNATTGVLTLTGSATLAAYQAELASVKFASSANDPTFANTDKSRSFAINASDGTLSATPLSVTMALTKPAGVTYTLTTSAMTIAGGGGDDVINAAANTLLSTDSIDGGLGTNTLNLTGTGTFKLATPKTLAHIQTVIGAEYQGTGQTIALRAGLNADVWITSGTPAAGNTAVEAVTVTGIAGDSSTIHLGKGTDTVTLGSATETITGTGGIAKVTAAAAVAGAKIVDTGASVAVTLTGGGTAALNTADVGIKTVTLNSATTAWNFSTDTESGLAITDLSGSKDSINLLGANATLTLGKGASTVSIHANPGKDTITGFTATGTAHDTLAIDHTVFADWAHVLGATTQSGSDLLITIDASDQILLKNVTLANFTTSDVKIV